MADFSMDRLGNCEVCGSITAKYTCPKCEVKTCSLKCVNIHKKELKCDGIRDPTKFITLDKFTNIDLLNDYRMLEQVNRVVEGLHKNKLPNEMKAGRRILPKYLHKLQLALQDRKINIKFLPKGFERRNKNRTRIHNQSKTVYWNVEWIFPNADNMKILEENCSENDKLSSVLHKYFNSELDDFQKEKLNFYRAAGVAGVQVFLKAENRGENKYFELDIGENLRENLSGKTIIEFPTIHVVLKGHDTLYDTIDSDNEETEAVQIAPKRKMENSGNEVLAKLLKEASKERSTKSSNLLFVSEYSDAELSPDEQI